MTDTERRVTAVAVEIRAGSGSMTIGGYAAKFNRISQNLGGFVERIAPTFFNKSAGDGWPGVIARYNHDDNRLLGTTAAATLRLSLDDVGLDYAADLPKTREDVFELVQRGDVRQSSFAFSVYEDEWGQTDQGFPMRTLVSGRLFDVAPVNTPAYEDTSVSTRSIDGALASLARKFEAPLEEVRGLAAAGELTKLFYRTDRPSGPVVAARAGDAPMPDPEDDAPMETPVETPEVEPDEPIVLDDREGALARASAALALAQTRAR